MTKQTKHNINAVFFALFNTLIMFVLAVMIAMVMLGITPQELINNF